MPPTERALSVADAMSLAKGALEQVRIRVVGEVSGATVKPGYKAVYFSLKDESALMPCLMWRDVYDGCGVALTDGQLVEITGFFTAYAPKGRMQFQARSVVAAGEGALRIQVAELARRLEAEGLMDVARKRPLPRFPGRIGLVTSPRGKAVHDVIRTLGRRYPSAELVIAGVAVEGDSAVGEIVRGLAAVGSSPGVEVVILARGGGSYEDLMPFNAEAVARAVVACPVPVVTGIGHEPDTSIADMVADVRASTPTAAAESVAPDRVEVARRVDAAGRMLGSALSGRVTAAAHRLNLLSHRPVLADPIVVLETQKQTLDVLAGALERALPARLERQRESMQRFAQSLVRVGPRLGERERVALARGRERAAGAGRVLLAQTGGVLGAAAARLEDLSPLGILGRGFAVCYSQDGAVVRDHTQVAAGARVRVRLARGRLGCVVEDSGSEE
ncbi:MAG: exodeoxyribonuclease VII large subunit [Coriobacteriia bacterium]|nr:exodeoxyribonuclease VII large subunit [Coriobacteriia bacterium]